MTTLNTERLNLCMMSLDEAQRVVDAAPIKTDAWAPGFPSDDDRIAAVMYGKTAGHDVGPFGTYRIERRSDGLTIGTLGFYGPPDRQGHVVIGYGLVESDWGRGYATEALRALVDLCRERPEIKVVEADTEHDNAASQRVLEKCGFAYLHEDESLFYYSIEVA
jgi:RimJ/RimL family protein N-acetyltransferase